MTALVPRLRRLANSVTQFEVFASCVGFFCLAIAQPILDLIGNNPEFFLARSAPASDIVLLGIALGLIAPGVVGLAVVGIRRINVMAGTAVHVMIIALLSMILLVEIAEQTTLDSVAVTFLVGGVGSISSVAFFYGSPMIRFFFKVVMVAPVAVVVSFVAISPVTRLIFDDAVVGPTGVRVGNPVPIVMVVFDEFPIASLIDGDGVIQKNNYPNYSHLAEDGIWFRNAVTNETNTERALPAILTGARAAPEAIPVLSDYPGNLFTLLDQTYEIDAIEDLTDLCPESACQTVDATSWQDRWAGTANDLRIVALHVVLPNTLTHSLPPIDQSWSEFDSQEREPSSRDQERGDADFDLAERFHEIIADEGGRGPAFTQFLNRLGPSGTRPSFDFIHVLLPHAPWEFLQDGKGHWSPRVARGTVDRGWSDDSWLVHQIYQRHLLQVQYTDTLVGQMIDRLEALDTYEETLVVVLADHGISFVPGIEHRRELTADRVGEIAAVPLFIKPPHQTDGVIEDYRAELIDVTPTIADILDVEIPWSVEGVTLMSTNRPVRQESVINSGQLVIGVAGLEKLEVAQRKVEVFGSGSLFGLAPPGTSDLLWTPLDQLDIEPIAAVKGEISNPDRYQDIDLGAEIVPAYVQGILEREVTDRRVTLAISVNGMVSAVTQSYVRDGKVLFQAIVPPGSFVPGENQLRLIYIEGSGPNKSLSFVDAP